jgi:hypothetical protein
MILFLIETNFCLSRSPAQIPLGNHKVHIYTTLFSINVSWDITKLSYHIECPSMQFLINYIILHPIPVPIDTLITFR